MSIFTDEATMFFRYYRLSFLIALVSLVWFTSESATEAFQAQTLIETQIEMPSAFGEHMVLQRDKEILIWGKSDPGATIDVSLSDQSVSSVCGDDGMWRATFPAMSAGGPHRMTIGIAEQEPEIQWSDVLIGEVWICSGQSNMQWRVKASANPEKEAAAANFPLIRHLGVARGQSIVPQFDFEGQWKVCTPENVPDFSAVAYYFGRKLHEELNIPIGLINSSWGGTRVEPWTPPVGFDIVPALAELSEKVDCWTPGSTARTKLIQDHIAATEKWIAVAKKFDESTGNFLPPAPPFPERLVVPKTHQVATKLFNKMIHPMVGLRFRGVIWYQGESNHTEGMEYYEKKKALIGGWRKVWKQGDFPFYFVQIAPFQYGKEDATILPQFWEAQARVTEIPNTAMAVISDIGNLTNIHPKNKQDVGARLAAFALKNDYGKDVIAGGPKFESLETVDGKLKVNFSNVGDGLRSRDGKPLSWFEVAGKAMKFHPAKATIDGDSVVLQCEAVTDPIAVRFAWNKRAEPNLVNSIGVPPTAFRVGETSTETSGE